MGGARKKAKAKAKIVSTPTPTDHQERLASLRTRYQECMERPEYWWIQDESIATIGQALEQRNFVVRPPALAYGGFMRSSGLGLRP